MSKAVPVDLLAEIDLNDAHILAARSLIPDSNNSYKVALGEYRAARAARTRQVNAWTSLRTGSTPLHKKLQAAQESLDLTLRTSERLGLSGPMQKSRLQRLKDGIKQIENELEESGVNGIAKSSQRKALALKVFEEKLRAFENARNRHCFLLGIALHPLKATREREETRHKFVRHQRSDLLEIARRKLTLPELRSELSRRRLR